MNRIEKLAKIIVNYSVKVSENDKVLISYQSTLSNSLIKAIIKEINKNKGIVFVKMVDPVINSILREGDTLDRLDLIYKEKKFRVENFDCFINIRYQINNYEGKNINQDMRKKLGDMTKEIDDIYINKKRWVLLNFPSVLDSFKAGMKIDEFYDYAFDVMTVNYEKLKKDIKPLKELMEKTKKVRIVSKNTDISFSIENIPVVPCVGEMNIPDGEIYTAPVKNSVNGKITYNVDAPYQGNIFKNISLSFVDGKIVKVESDNDTDKLNKIFDTDKGSRYIGEFALGFNPRILNPMGDILYDEKIFGSIHFTPGRAYKNAFNGNISSIHWDLVLIQRKSFGGGEIYFDDVLIRKDGFFTLDCLKQLNI